MILDKCIWWSKPMGHLFCVLQFFRGKQDNQLIRRDTEDSGVSFGKSGEGVNGHLEEQRCKWVRCLSSGLSSLRAHMKSCVLHYRTKSSQVLRALHIICSLFTEPFGMNYCMPSIHQANLKHWECSTDKKKIPLLYLLYIVEREVGQKVYKITKDLLVQTVRSTMKEKQSSTVSSKE